ncbi:MAG: MBOAT family protein [Verrucomicrobia bacterium]|nr:MBOAT family protein [Verrucomicrobiota bacterium]
MLFQSWTFILFFLVVYPVYLLIRETRLRVPWLFAASYVFYGAWNPYYLLLILYSTAADYFFVTRMAKGGRRRFWVGASVVNNLALLGFFKYADFLVNNFNALLHRAGVGWSAPPPNVLLPVGISFFVFQSMSYTIDYYRGRVEREPSFLRYAAFVALFPQLVAGPIERAKNLLPQLRKAPRVGLSDVSDGLSLFLTGFFKKVALAASLALYVDRVYDAPERFGASALLLATFAFAWQIYFDFSGYTDMARGVARMMGVRLMLNFNNPYLADSLRDFWNRWHISLSTWFKDYVYIPLGGNRRGKARTYWNMALTMVISGLWHGAAWTFVAWGALHALGRVLTRELETAAFYRERLPRFVKQAFVFGFVLLTWTFFRAQSIHDAWLIVSRIFTAGWGDPKFPLLAAGLIASVWGYQFLYESKLRRFLELKWVRTSLAAGMVLYLLLVPGAGARPFIYFQF